MYGKAFSAIYNARWHGFAKRVAPLILDYYERRCESRPGQQVLDLCCGTGQFAVPALERGYRILGIDASPHMLQHARRNAESYVARGAAEFIEARAENFTVEERCSLAVSLFDSLNHLPDLGALAQCFACTYKATLPGGIFVFDLNSRAGLRRWNTISVTDDDEVLIVNRGLYIEGEPRALVKITGFLRTESGLYERFEEDMFNTIFDFDSVAKALKDAGWADIHMARAEDLGTPLTDPEKENRVFFVARHP